MSIRSAAARHALLPLASLLSRGGYWDTVRRRLTALERSQWWSADRILAHQLAQLNRLVRHAHRAVPFYRARFRDVGLEPGDIQSLEAFAEIPPLTREDLRGHYRALIAEGWHERVEPNATGGSCGQPVRFAIDRGETALRAAAAIRHNAWVGWNLGDLAGVLWGAPGDLAGASSLRERMARACLTPTIGLNAFEVSPGRLAAFGEALRDHRARVLFGYAGALVEFARAVRASGRRPPRLRTVVSSAEALSTKDRRDIERSLGCPVYDRYGARETGLVASECALSSGLHIACEDVYVEIGRDGRDGTGRVLVTKLNSMGMPFIRYDIGDLAAWEPGACACGRQLPRLKLGGCRTTDFLVGCDGRLVSGAALTLVTRDLPELGTVQLHQTDPERVEVRLAGEPSLPESVRLELSDRLRAHLGPVSVSFSFHSTIERAPSGKYRFTVCRVDEGLLRKLRR